MDMISVKNLTKVYCQISKKAGIIPTLKSWINDNKICKTAIDDISFSIKEGQVVGLLGPNGAGKTTLLKMLTGILYPTKGDIFVNKYVPYLREDEYKKSISVILGHRSQLLWSLPAIDTYLWLKEIYDINNTVFNKTLNMLLDIFNAGDLINVQVRRLSLGQRMKMELIAQMIHNPKIVFLDEPTIGLDISTQNILREFILEYNRKTNATVVLTSHNIRDIEDMCQQAILLNEGKIVINCSIENLIRESCEYKKIVIYSLNNNFDLQSILGIKDYKQVGNKTILHIRTNLIMDTIKIICSHCKFEDITVENMRLDDILQQIYNKG